MVRCMLNLVQILIHRQLLKIRILPVLKVQVEQPLGDGAGAGWQNLTSTLILGLDYASEYATILKEV